MSTQAFSTNPFKPFNPFLAPEIEAEIEDVGEPAEAVYALVQNGPAVPADEVESHLDSVEVTVKWGTQTMVVKHLEAGQSFVLGEDGDFVMPEEVLGAARVVVVEARGDSFYAGDECIVANAKIQRVYGAFTVDIAGVRAGKKIPYGFMASLAGGALGAIALSFLGHSAILASMALFMPSMGADDAESVDRTQMLQMQALLNASADREQEKLNDPVSGDEPTGGGATGGEPTKGPEGAAGTPAAKTQGHMAFKGENQAPQLSRREELKLAENFGMIGMLNSGAKADGPATPWAQTDHAGSDRENKMGALWGPTADDAMGYGFGLSGTGEGGGGNGEGVGIDGVGNTIGGGGGGPGKWGFGKGDKDGMGNGHGPGHGGHTTRAPNPREVGPTTVNGHLPAEAIQRVVRLNFGKFRMCYEDALKSNPSLHGRVVTKFMIGRDGTVTVAQDGGSDLPDQKVTSCIVRQFQNLTFPTPEGGQVSVVYPLNLTPSE